MRTMPRWVRRALKNLFATYPLVALKPVLVGPLMDEILPHRFFRTRQDDEVHLAVWRGFISRVLVHASQRIANQSAVGIYPFILTRGLFEHEIWPAMPVSHVFNVDECLWVLASLLKLQPQGEAGVFPNDGRISVFYVQIEDEVWVIHVSWYRDERRWHVFAWRFDGDDLRSHGSLIFSRHG